MRERLYQHGFTDDFKLATPRDVTPKRFKGLGVTYEQPQGVIRPTEDLGRFVREPASKTHISGPADAAAYLMEKIFHPFERVDQEELWVLLLNNKHVVTHEVLVYRGMVNRIDVRLAELFKDAVRHNAPSILLSHAHPSGIPDASREDIRLTEHALEAARMLDIWLLDHLVVGDGVWVSLKELEVIDW